MILPLNLALIILFLLNKLIVISIVMHRNKRFYRKFGEN